MFRNSWTTVCSLLDSDNTLPPSIASSSRNFPLSPGVGGRKTLRIAPGWWLWWWRVTSAWWRSFIHYTPHPFAEIPNKIMTFRVEWGHPAEWCKNLNNCDRIDKFRTLFVSSTYSLKLGTGLAGTTPLVILLYLNRIDFITYSLLQSVPHLGTLLVD